MLEYVPGERDGLPIADVARPAHGRPPLAAALAALRALPGWLLASEDGALIGALLDRGAVERRHAFVMSASLTPGPHVSDASALELAPLPAVADMYPSWRRAYPPGHPDFEPGTDAEVIDRCWSHLGAGAHRSALHRSSGVVVRNGDVTDGGVIAGIIVALRPEPSPYGGPWISDIWVDPAHAGQGIGAALIRRAQGQLAEDGHDRLGLAVTHGNPARRVYERAGFTPALESWTVRLPA